jgi:hypothetical protein
MPKVFSETPGALLERAQRDLFLSDLYLVSVTVVGLRAMRVRSTQPDRSRSVSRARHRGIEKTDSCFFSEVMVRWCFFSGLLHFDGWSARG